MTVHVVTGIPFGSRKSYILGVFESEEDAKSAFKIHEEYGYSDLEIEEVEFYEHYVDNSLDYD